jgi:hypothetical protein
VLTRSKKSKKLSTLEIDKGRIERHIKPLLGQLKVAAVTTDDVDKFMHDVARRPATRGAKKSGGWLAYEVAKLRPAALWAFLAGYSPMPSAIGCARTTQYVA